MEFVHSEQFVCDQIGVVEFFNHEGVKYDVTQDDDCFYFIKVPLDLVFAYTRQLGKHICDIEVLSDILSGYSIQHQAGIVVFHLDRD